MGDRCYCDLTIIGILHPDHTERLAAAIAASSPDDIGGLEKIREALQAGRNHFDYYEVNYAQMDEGLEAELTELRLGYIWHNDAGDEYGPADNYYDAVTGEAAEHCLSNGAICLTLDEIDREGVLENARRWQAFAKEAKFFAPRSNHEFLALATDPNVPKGWFDLAAAPLAEVAEN